MAQVIRTDGSVTEVQPKNGTDFQLDELKKIVNGYIEIVHLRGAGNTIMVVNEEGKLCNLPVNEKATFVAWQFGGMQIFRDVVVGDVLLCKDDEVR